MKKPTLKQIDAIRKEGFRPGVVACIVRNSKILMFYKKEYGLWLLPQGGIKNGEFPKDALKRELTEEIGKTFTDQLDIDKAVYFDNDRMEFKPGKHDLREIQDDEGNTIKMIGKDYMLYVVPALTDEINIEETEYDQCFWMTFREAYFIADKIYQRGKRRITLKILNALQSNGVIA